MYTIKTAAEATGKTKSSILRAIQKGRISATRGETGEWIIDPAELHRVYPPLPRTDADANVMHQDAPPTASAALASLEMENKMLREQLARERDVSADLARRLDVEAEERRRLTYLLTHQPEKSPDSSRETPAAPSERPTLVEKLFGRDRRRGG